MYLASQKFTDPCIDIKFSNTNGESLIKDEALRNYQENAYLIGKVFSNEEVESSSEEGDHEEDVQALKGHLEQMQNQFKAHHEAQLAKHESFQT